MTIRGILANPVHPRSLVMIPLFDTAIESQADAFAGPWRGPRQMLAAQSYDNHTSIHDDATARKLGFKGGTIEGPTHFSQFVPLCVHVFGTRWFEQGCLSAHYRNVCYEGDRVRAFLAQRDGTATQVNLWMQRTDGTEILRGTAALGTEHPPTALAQRLTELTPLTNPVILRDVRIGMRSK